MVQWLQLLPADKYFCSRITAIGWLIQSINQLLATIIHITMTKMMVIILMDVGSNKPPLTQFLCVSVSLPWSGHHPRHGCGWAVGRPCSNHPPPPETSPHPVMTGVISTISNRRQQGEGGSCLALCSFQFPSYFVSVCVFCVCLGLFSIWTPPSKFTFTFVIR